MFTEIVYETTLIHVIIRSIVIFFHKSLKTITLLFTSHPVSFSRKISNIYTCVQTMQTTYRAYSLLNLSISIY